LGSGGSGSRADDGARSSPWPMGPPVTHSVCTVRARANPRKLGPRR
jgi:hypothetical protein